MCFSARASFGASAALLIIGAVAVNKSKTVPQRVLACVPLIFSVQQFTEGVLWLSFMHEAYSHWRDIAMYCFLIFAQVVWPFYVPLAVMLCEENKPRKKILSVFFGIGVLVSVYLSYCLLMYPASCAVADHHIRYNFSFPGYRYGSIAYFLPTVLAPFFSTIKGIRWLGLTLLVSYIASRLFYAEYVVSVWCYFAALISLVVLFVIMHLNKVPPVEEHMAKA